MGLRAGASRGGGSLVGVGRWAWLTLVVMLWVLACRPAASNLPSQFLWPEETVLRQIEDGWVHGVPAGPSRTLPVAKEGRLRLFRTVALAVAGPASLVVERGATQQTFDLGTPQAIEIDLSSEVRLRAEGDVLLLWPRRVDAHHRGRRVVLAVADTLRFDHANQDLMPGTSAFFADGRRYSRAYSAASWTLPSMAALFTGRRPAALRQPDGSLIAIPSQHETVASKMVHRGFVTVGITANYTINHENGYSAGFGTFFAPTPQGRSGDFRDAEWVGQLARRHVHWLPDVDLFLYLQFMDSHDPYRDHELGGERVAPQTGHQPTVEELDGLRGAYASEVRYLDRHLAALLPDLEAQRIVFTSDHGEEFFDHGGFRHGPALYPESVHVPLWIRGEGIEPGVETEPVSLIDLHPVLLGDSESVAPAESPVTMETFSFGPPRWSWVDGPWQWILMAREIPFVEPETPVGRWLWNQHPLVQVLDGSASDPASSQALSGLSDLPTGNGARRLPKVLAEYFQGFRRGLFVQVPALTERLELEDIDGSGWAWGRGKVHLESLGEGHWALEAEAEEPFLLLFLRAAEGRMPQLVDAKEGTLRPLVDEGIQMESGLQIWFDEGRSPESLQGTQKTLKRLKALGYI